MTAELSPREVLGIGPGDGAAEARQAYRRLAMRWHPDRDSLLAEAPRLRALDDLVLARPAVRKAFEDHEILL